MNKRTRAATVGAATALALGLIGCSGSHSTSVSGNRDDVKHKSAVTQVATRPTYRTDCSGVSGVSFIVEKPKPPKIKKAPKAPSTPKTSNCRKIKTGVESYQQQVSAEKWCVELDNVNGHKSDDDRWFTVTRSTYVKWAAKHEGDRVTKMHYLHIGC